MKQNLLTLTILVMLLPALPNSARADATVNWAQLDYNLALSYTNPFPGLAVAALPTNSVLWIGMFTNITASQISAWQDNIGMVLPYFVRFADGYVGSGCAVGYNGMFDMASANGNTIFENQQIYLLAFDVQMSGNYNVTNASQWAVVTSPDWLFPPNQISVFSFDLYSYSNIVVGELAGPVVITTVPTNEYANASIALHPVPEPSALLLVLLGVGGLLVLQRKRR